MTKRNIGTSGKIEPLPLSRREFLRNAGFSAVVLGLTAASTSCSQGDGYRYADEPYSDYADRSGLPRDVLAYGDYVDYADADSGYSDYPDSVYTDS